MNSTNFLYFAMRRKSQKKAVWKMLRILISHKNNANKLLTNCIKKIAS